MTKLAENLKRELENQGMTQAALAEASGVSQPSIFKILKGRTKKTRHLPEIANALGVTAESLLGIEERGIENISDNPRFERIKALFGQLEAAEIDKGIDYLETLAANSALKKFRDK